MAQPVVDSSMLGDKELERMLAKLPDRFQRKVGRQSFQASAKRLQAHVISNLQGAVVDVQTGKYVQVMQAMKPKPGKRSRSRIRVEVPFPPRSELGIEPGDEAFWPAAVEYGHRIVRKGKVVGYAPPHPAIRNAVNDHEEQEKRLIGRDIRQGITREARKLAKG